jgi:hypothetical protein
MLKVDVTNREDIRGPAIDMPYGQCFLDAYGNKCVRLSYGALRFSGDNTVTGFSECGLVSYVNIGAFAKCVKILGKVVIDAQFQGVAE